MQSKREMAMATPCTCDQRARLFQWAEPCRSARCVQGRLNVEKAAFLRAHRDGGCTCGYRWGFESRHALSRQFRSAKDCTSSRCEGRGADRGTRRRLPAERTRGIYRSYLHLAREDASQESVPAELSCDMPLAEEAVLQATGWI